MKFLLSLVLCLFCAKGQAATYVFTGEAVSIPTSGPADPSFIQVVGVEGSVVRITVAFRKIRHSYAQEVMMALSNPNGWSTLIFAAPRCQFHGVDVLFADDAPVEFATACSGSIATGTYTPGFSNSDWEFSIPIAPLRPFLETLNELSLADPNGRWILWSEDFVSGDGGTIDGWELTIETDSPDESTPPEESIPDDY